MTLALTPASAEKIGGEKFHDEGTFTVQDFCGVPGLVVDGEFTVDGRFLERLQGREKTFYAMDNTRVVQVFTNRATGQQATDIQPRTTSKDLRVTDNGDGTTPVIQLLTGGNLLRGDSGRLIAKGDGQVRFRIVFDNATGDELSSELIFGSTGTNDDFCAAILEDWGLD
jgi:hypothetical protein